jgi:glutathione peroxidase
MNRIGWLVAVWMGLAPVAVQAGTAQSGFRFASIDGGQIDMAAYDGHPVLVVNTASLCGFSDQYDDLQALQDRYGPEGLVVIAVPSDDFRQELGSDAEVKKFCAVNFDLTLAMTAITPVTGDDAHPFYKWLRDEHGFTPVWNFNKVLIGRDGEVVDTWGSMTRPTSKAIRGKIEAQLN